MGGIVFDPCIPVFLYASAFIVSAAIIIFSYRKTISGGKIPPHSRTLIVLRLLAIAVILLVLAKPEWVRTVETRQLETVVLLVDASESMEIRDAGNGSKQRFEQAVFLAEEASRALEGDFAVRVLTFSNAAIPVEPKSLGEREIQRTGATNIGGSLHQAAQGESGDSMAGIVLFSDGVHNMGPSPESVAEKLRAREISVFALGLGAEGEYRDLDLREFSAPQLVYRGETVELHLRVANYGFSDPHTSLTVEVLRHDPLLEGHSRDPRTGQTIFTENQGFPSPGNERTWKIPFPAEYEGTYVLRARVKPLPEEGNLDNNEREVQFRITRERIRVLLIEGTPRWEFGFIFRALAGDPRFAPIGLLRMSEKEFHLQGVVGAQSALEGRTRFPIPLRPIWEEFDAVILGDVAHLDLSPESWRRLYETVSEGLRLIRVPGLRMLDEPPRFEGASELILFEELRAKQRDRVFISPTASGRIHPLMPPEGEVPGAVPWMEISSNSGQYVFRDVLPGSQVLAEAAPSPGVRGPAAIVLRPVGKGSVLAFTVDDTWRWRVGDSPFQASHSHPFTFWRRAVRWLVTGEVRDPEEGLHLLLERDRFLRGEPVRVLARLAFPAEVLEAGVRLEAAHIDPEGVEKPVHFTSETEAENAGTRILDFVTGHAGIHVIRARVLSGGRQIGTAEVSFQVEESGLERAQTSLNRGLLERLTRVTGGLYRDDPEIGPILESLRRNKRAIVSHRRVRTRLWDSPVLFVLFLGFLASEWILRKRRDMA